MISKNKTVLIYKELSHNWMDHKDSMMAAAIAYKAILSIVPLFIILMAITNIFFGSDSSLSNEILKLLANFFGENSAYAISNINIANYLENAGQSYNTHLYVAIIGIALLVYSSSSVLLEMVLALDTIWDIKHTHSKFYYLKKRLIAMLVVVIIGLVLIAIKLLDASVDIIKGYQIISIPTNWDIFISFTKNLSFPILFFIFTIIFKLLPTTDIKWKDVSLAALCTAILFGIGQFLLGWYFKTNSLVSLYGAASSIIVFMFWANYSAMIILLGAEISKLYTYSYGSRKKTQKTQVGNALK